MRVVDYRTNLDKFNSMVKRSTSVTTSLVFGFYTGPNGRIVFPP